MFRSRPVPGTGRRWWWRTKTRSPAVVGELLLDPAIAAAADLAVVEVGLGRVDGDDRHAADPQHRVPLAEELLEVHVADVAGVVVAGMTTIDSHSTLSRYPRLLVLGLEAERRQVARADDDIRLQIVDLGDRPLEQAGHEVGAAAVEGQFRSRRRLDIREALPGVDFRYSS